MNQHLQQLLGDVDADANEADELRQLNTERCHEIVGEALRQLSDMSMEVAERLPGYRSFISLHNILAHQYAVLENDIVWAAAKNRLPAFCIEV